ncbi:adenylate/guanylate cyclase domain-containing protein [Mycobacterium sp.]|uniref:adenylate/guanylate cyclase domain-containing protein n=1 Tax=Mycobacterium sp. TaxID=1785 RepID=UPI003F9A202C
MTQIGLVCGSCGAQSSPTAKFCSECGTPLNQATRTAEYKQVTVLFADVVHSMYIASVVGAERLREIMADLVNITTAVVKRYGGTVDKFTGDGIMAVFGAPLALEDHAVRACLAALAIQDELARLAARVRDRDGVELALRVGLNSGQVIAGEVGSASLGYTTMGEQVGVAQRMESVAPPGGVMLSASTARLLDGAAALSEPESVQFKGADQPVAAYRLLGMREQHRAASRVQSNLVGRRWEMFAVEGLLDRAIGGHGAVVAVAGPPGIGKSRLVREVSAMAATRGAEVFTAFCESHTNQIPFRAVARLLRAAIGVEGLDGQAARDRVRDRVPDVDPEDLLLLDDLLGIGDPGAPLPRIDPDARRRRLTALINAASLARTDPALCVIEDAHWIDEVSESMLADFFTVIPGTPSMVLITYRPEYEGALARMHGAQTIALAPLSDSESATLVSEMLGADPSVDALGRTITDRAAGNPFFVQEIVRDLAERGVLRGKPGAYMSTAEVAEVNVPATLQATIAARIDRLPPEAKRTLSAAAVIGSRFTLRLLTQLGVEPAIDDLAAAQLIDRVRFTRQPEYVFHHPLIRAVAYESQLKSDRAVLHRRVATAIQEGDPGSVDVNAALIARQLEAAGDLRPAFDWHMRAAGWLTSRDIGAAGTSWQRARHVADRLPADDPDRMVMRIAPRTMLCATNWLAGGGVNDAGLAELRELCAANGDQTSLAMGMAGLVMAFAGHNRNDEATQLASELTALLDAIGNPTLTAGLLPSVIYIKSQVGEMTEALRLAQRSIDLADGDPTKDKLLVGSPLAWATMMRGLSRLCLGIEGWHSDADEAVVLGAGVDRKSYVSAVMYKYVVAVPVGALSADAVALRETAEALRIAEQVGDDHTVALAQLVRGVVLVHHGGTYRHEGFSVLTRARDIALQKGFTLNALAVVDPEIARERARTGDLDGAIELSRAAIDDMFERGAMFLRGFATTVLVESLLARGTEGDVEEAHAAIERLAAVPTDPGFVLHELPLLRMRALSAAAHGDGAGYRDYRDRYRAMARTLGFEGHTAMAEAMP